MSKQVTNKAFMVRPRGFGYNHETAATNPYQNEVDLQGEALELEIWREYVSIFRRIRNHGVYTIEDLNSSEETLRKSKRSPFIAFYISLYPLHPLADQDWSTSKKEKNCISFAPM